MDAEDIALAAAAEVEGRREGAAEAAAEQEEEEEEEEEEKKEEECVVGRGGEGGEGESAASISREGEREGKAAAAAGRRAGGGTLKGDSGRPSISSLSSVERRSESAFLTAASSVTGGGEGDGRAGRAGDTAAVLAAVSSSGTGRRGRQRAGEGVRVGGGTAAACLVARLAAARWLRSCLFSSGVRSDLSSSLARSAGVLRYRRCNRARLALHAAACDSDMLGVLMMQPAASRVG